jgi:hypothetical protein
LPNPPKWAKLKPGVSLTLDKSWGQCQRLFVLFSAWLTAALAHDFDTARN